MTAFLVRPSAAFRDSYIEALREGFTGSGTRPSLPAEEIDAIAADFETHLGFLDRDGRAVHGDRGRVLPGVPSNMFWLVDNGVFIGSISIRARIDTHVLACYGGHIGYGIRPSKRRLGYGNRQLALGLRICRGMGIGVVRISCGDGNVGSRRIIEANGGLFLRRSEHPWFPGEPVLLFDIPLLEAEMLVGGTL